MRNEVGVLLQDMAFITNEWLHGRFLPQADVILPPVREVGASCPRQRPDAAAAAILEFMRAGNQETRVFDQYLRTNLRREVNEDD